MKRPAGMRSSWNTHTLLVGMQNGKATLENRAVFLQS